MESSEQFLIEQLMEWLSQTGRSVIDIENDPRLGYLSFQMYWMAAPTPEHKVRALLGMAYYEKQLEKSERTTSVVRMALQSLAGAEHPKADQLAYSCAMLGGNPPGAQTAFAQTVDLLNKVAKQNFNKWKLKSVALPSKKFQPGANLASQYTFFEHADKAWLAKWIRQTNEVAASYLYSLPEIVGASSAYAKHAEHDGLGEIYPHRNKIFIRRGTSVFTLSRKGERREIISSKNFKLDESLGQCAIHPSGQWIAYQKTLGRRGASIHFLNIDDPSIKLAPITGEYPGRPYWASNNDFYFVDYQKVSGRYEHARILVTQPFIKERRVRQLFVTNKLGTSIGRVWPLEQENCILFTLASSRPRRKVQLICLRLDGGNTCECLFESEDLSLEAVDKKGAWIISPDEGYPNGRLRRVPCPWSNGDNKRLLELHTDNDCNSLIHVTACGDNIVALFRSAFESEIRIIPTTRRRTPACPRADRHGAVTSVVKLPFRGVVDSLYATHFDRVVFMLSNAETRSDIFELSVKGQAIHRYLTTPLENRPFPINSEVIQATANDGTKVSVLLLSKQPIEKSGTNSLICYGYGGHNVPAYNGYDSRIAAWLELGGIWAIAAVRGGGDLGLAWSRQAIRETKNRSRDDFISVCKHLIDERYTSPDHLGIIGGSAGGMLIGSVLAKAPELFNAAVTINGIHDMAKLNAYTEDYGDARRGNAHRARMEYSPLHNLKPNVSYPATLVVVSTKDQIVAAWNSYKFYCALKQCQSGDKPILMRSFDCDHDLRGAYQCVAEILGFFAHHLGLSGA